MVNINIGKGVQDIIFGMSEADVKTRLHRHFEIVINKFGGEMTTKDYIEDGIEYSFSSEDEFKLSSINITSKDYGIANEPIVGKYLHILIEFFEELNFHRPTIDSINTEYAENHLMVYYDNEGLILNFIDYLCVGFAMSPLMKNEEEYIWPDLNQVI